MKEEDNFDKEKYTVQVERRYIDLHSKDHNLNTGQANFHNLPDNKNFNQKSKSIFLNLLNSNKE